MSDQVADPRQLRHTSAAIQELLKERTQQEAPLARLRPLVLLPGFLTTIQTGQWPIYGSDAASMEVLRQVGASPFALGSTPLIEGDHLTVVMDDGAFHEAFDAVWSLVLQVDIRGLCLAGGGDLISTLYGPNLMAQTEGADLWRDLWERYLLLLAWLLRWPTLGLCRGAQHMNVVLGGGLVQDLRGQWRQLWAPYAKVFEVPPLLRHRGLGRNATPESFSTHAITIDPGSRFARLVQMGTHGGAGSLFEIDAVLSQHEQAIGFVLPNHQIVGAAAPGHRIGAVSPDGVIEAMEAVGDRFWIATQFQPEWQPELAWSRGLFSGFTQACRAYTPLSRTQLQEWEPAIRAWVRAHDRAAFGWPMAQGLATGKKGSDESWRQGESRPCMDTRATIQLQDGAGTEETSVHQ
jgi:gamma-glutamyl-gamma-aminobutyrate hydrolase PuuD